MSSDSGKTKLFIFGATGQLGLAFISAITSNSRYSQKFHITAIIRPDTLQSQDEKKSAALAKVRGAGVTLVEGNSDSATVEQVAKWISGQDIVLSFISYYGTGTSPDMKLVEAVKLAKVSWFIPSSYGVDLTSAFSDPVPAIQAKQQVVKAIRSYGINSIFIMVGLFMDYFIAAFGGVDIAGGTITAPYSFDSKLTSTKPDDIAHLTAELLLRREEASVKNQVVHLSGSTVSYNELHALLEEHFKKPFKKIVATKEQTVDAWRNDAKFEKFMDRFRVLFGEQKGVYWYDSWNAKYAKDIKVTTLKEFIANLK